MQVDTSTRSGMASITIGDMAGFQQQRGPTGAVQGSLFPGQQLQGQFLPQSNPPNFQNSLISNAAHSKQSQQSYQMNGASSSLMGTQVIRNQHQSFSSGQMQKPSPTSPNTPNFQQGGFTPNRGANSRANSTNSSPFSNSFNPNNNNTNIYANLLGMMNQSGNAPSPYAPNASLQQNSASGAFPNNFQQQTRALPNMHGQNAIVNYAAQFPGLEPTPIRTTPQHGNVGAPSQNPVSFGSLSFAQTQSNADANDLSQMLGQDFFSPTPIHPNHQHRVANNQQQKPPTGMSPYQAFPSSSSGQPVQGFNHHNMGQFSNHQP